jgi:hypothetical protein
VCLLTPLFAYPQMEISKEEIRNRFIADFSFYRKIDQYKTHFDTSVVSTIEKLKKSGIDTLGVYEERYIGSLSQDTCLCGSIPWIVYLQWKRKGLTYNQKITECCKSDSIRIKSSPLIEYYIACKKLIEPEIILPVITGASKNIKGEFLYNTNLIDHTTQYSIYCSLNHDFKLTSFKQSYLDDKKSIFYQDNLKSRIRSWHKIIMDQIKEIK